MATTSTAKSCKYYLWPYHGHKWCMHYPVLAIFANLLCYPNVCYLIINIRIIKIVFQNRLEKIT